MILFRAAPLPDVEDANRYIDSDPLLSPLRFLGLALVLGITHRHCG